MIKTASTVEKSLDRLNLGCGTGNVPAGWINLDGSWNAWLSKQQFLRKLLAAFHLLPPRLIDDNWDPRVVVHDVRKPLPFPDESLQSVYASHLLEHLYLMDANNLLKECYRILKTQGTLRIVVPDLNAITEEYIGKCLLPVPPDKNWADMNPGDRMNLRLIMRSPNGPSTNAIVRIYTALNDFHTHKWMYDTQSLTFHLTEAGFVDVKAMAFRKSRIEGIEFVEKAARVLDGAGICVEGIKPGTSDHRD